MIYFQQLNHLGHFTNSEWNKRETVEEVLAFFEHWNTHPFKRRFFISNEYVVFEYLDGRHINIAHIKND